MAYIGVQPADAYTSFAVQHFTTSATTSYTLDNPVANENEIALFINNVRQEPGSSYAYTASGTTLTLSAATSASDTMYCVFIGKAVQSVTPANGSVTGAMMSYPLTTFSSTGIDDNASSTAITIDSSQNVGIGTSSPNNHLVVNGGVATTGSASAGLTTGMLFDQTASTLCRILCYSATNSSLAFYTGSSSSASERMRIDSSGNVGIGTSSPTFNNGTGLHLNSSTTDCRFHITNSSTGSTASDGAYIVSGGTGDMLLINQENANMLFYTNATERMRMTSNGVYLIGKTASGLGSTGHEFHGGGFTYHTRSGDVMYINRTGSDGTLVSFYQDTASEGYIGVSGSTVSYNGFTGTHWSRLIDNSKPTILKGTILESLDEMCDWYQVKFDITQTDDEGNNTTFTEKVSYALQEGQSVGDIITYNHEGIDYQATIIQEDDIKHTKSKVSDTVDAKNVYGVFMDWDNDDNTVNDMLIAQTGTFVVRMNSAETVSKGDLIQSNGDGTGKVQADDIIRASTVAKVLSTTKIETYEDGSYIVPCSLHC